MKFLNDLLKGESAENLSYSADLGGVFGNAVGSLIAGKVQREQSKTKQMIAEINAKRSAREARYQLGLTKVANQGDAYSNAVFQAAENARAASQAMGNELLAFNLADIEEKSRLPSMLETGGGFVQGLATAHMNREARRVRREI